MFEKTYTDIVLVIATLVCVVLVVSVISTDDVPGADMAEGETNVDALQDLDEEIERARTRGDESNEKQEELTAEEASSVNYQQSSTEQQEEETTDSGPSGPWDRIVIHHSGTRAGSVEAFDRHHREVIGFDGIKYHFVIGNGEGMKNGEIQATFRWQEQIPGPQVGRSDVDETAIGICLVGNFNQDPPTHRQQEFLERLVKVLVNEYNIPPSRIQGAGELSRSLGGSPGTLLDLEDLKEAVR